MSKHTQIAPSAIEISHIVIRQDSEGRYCLNDLHKAAGSDPRHQPTNWLRLSTTQELCAEIDRSSHLMNDIERLAGFLLSNEV